MAFQYYLVATGMGPLFSFMLQSDSDGGGRLAWWVFAPLWTVLVLVAASAITYISLNDSVIHQPRVSVVLAFLISLETFLLSFESEVQTLWLVVFLYAAGLGLLFLYNELKAYESIRTLEFERLIPIAVLLVVFYAIWVYGQIGPSYGGGHPQPAVLYLDRPVEGLSTERLSTAIIEETDYGYYCVASSGNAKAAIFIPRVTVAGIYYGKK